MVEVDTNLSNRISQGDIYKNVEYIQKVEQISADEIQVSKIVFPLVIVLTQDCDLQQDSAYYIAGARAPSTSDKKLLSVIVAPLYNEELFLDGKHLEDESINLKMRFINKISRKKLSTEYKSLINNDMPRYHSLKFNEVIPIVDSVIDFKHYFTVDVDSLIVKKEKIFVCKVNELYREQITQRFANFLSRIGLPNPS